MSHELRRYIKLDAVEPLKITFMTLLLVIMFARAASAYGSHLILHPSQIKAPETKNLDAAEVVGMDATFMSGVRPSSDPVFSLPKVIEVLETDRSRLAWFTYPASVRGRVFFGFAPDAIPSFMNGSGGGW